MRAWQGDANHATILSMISQLLTMLVITAFPLGFISLLLYIRLGSQGMPRRRIYRVIAEVWGVFALIFTIFTLVSQHLGPVPAQNSIANEMLFQVSRFRTLPAGHQMVIGAALLLAVALFAHLVWSIQRVQRHASQLALPPDGGSHDLDA